MLPLSISPSFLPSVNWVILASSPHFIRPLLIWARYKRTRQKLFPHDNKGHWLQMMTKAENFSNHLFHDADLTQLFLYWTGMFQTFAHLLYSIPALWRDLVVHHQNYFFNNWQYRGAKVWFLHEILISCPYLWLKDRKYAATSKQFIPWWNF